MTIKKMFLSLSIGLLLAVIAIALIPFLVVFSWAEIAGISEFYASPLFLIEKLYKSDKKSKID